MKVFLTGGTGFIGSYVMKNLLNAGHEVFALKRKGSQPKITLDKEPIWVEGNLTDNHEEYLKGTDTVLHLLSAGVSPQKASIEELFRINVLESLQLCISAIESGVKRIITTGSSLEYGSSTSKYDFIPPDAPLEPVESYGASKAAFYHAINALCHDRQFELIYLRLFSIYGDGQYHKNFWPALKKAALAGENFPMTPGEQIRDFLDVETAAQSIVENLESKATVPGKPLVKNLASGKPQSILNFANYWWQQWSAKGNILPGKIPYRKSELMRMVPQVKNLPIQK